MKLKNVLVLAFLILTLIPVFVVSLLLYKSGYELSKESYTRNLIESINVQEDYISQTIENNMIADYRFANKAYVLANGESSSSTYKSNLIAAFQSYLEASEDKISVCILFDKNNIPIYTIGDKTELDTVSAQLPELSELKDQTIMEFDLGDETYSLGVITPIWSSEDEYAGSLISIYDKSYIFKIISSYYKIADTDTYIYRKNGEIINSGVLSDEKRSKAVEKALNTLTYASEGIIDMNMDKVPVTGYYKNISNTPWYLVGFIEDQLIYTFTNQFVFTYIIIIIAVLVIDVILALYFSKKVVEPINHLIKAMDGYQNSLSGYQLQKYEKKGYYETQYLHTKFSDLMKTIILIQHNFKGVYQLYQSNDMGDINIDIDVKNQTIQSNKEEFKKLMKEIHFEEGACIVDRFVNCFCEKDQVVMTEMFENMRDKHLSVARETEIYTPYLNQKWYHTLVVPMYEDARLSKIFVQLRDISSFKKKEMESFEQVRRDSLTRLYNRKGFTEKVSNTLMDEDSRGMHALFFIDMDYFKMVNDNLGHREGDKLLCSVAQILLDVVGTENLTSRFGGDEFAIFLQNTSQEAIEQTKQELGKRLIYPFNTDKISFVVSASIGVATWSDTAPITLEELLHIADNEMYHAKREFKNGIDK